MKTSILAAAVAFAVSAGAAAAQTAPADSVDGVWQGELKVHQDSLPIVIHFGQQVTGDSPAERIFGAPGTLQQTGDRYKVVFRDVGEFDGALTKDGKLTGTYTRGDLSEPLVLERQEAAKP